MAAICLLSGAAGLIFETVWFHRAGLVFGSSVWSTSMVLSSFMGGLAIGAAIVARYGLRIAHLLRGYAAAEATVAVSGVAITQILPAFTNIASRLAHSEGDLWGANAGRFAAGFAVLLIP